MYCRSRPQYRSDSVGFRALRSLARSPDRPDLSKASLSFGAAACLRLLPHTASRRQGLGVSRRRLAQTRCVACRHNRMIPYLGAPDNFVRWRKIEIAKHRLMYTLLRLRLPLATRAETPDGLVFDFLAAGDIPVMTGHADGAITINITEADDAERERIRGRTGEPHRTLLGHFRHESGHYYWDRLVRSDSSKLDAFRSIFGDERQDYASALQKHYRLGRLTNWPDRFVTAYASAHPWEDFAESWAHYLHIVDTLETASTFGLAMHPRHPQTDQLSVAIDFDPRCADFARLVDAWLPLTFAINSINRSMGLPDLYPFLAPNHCQALFHPRADPPQPGGAGLQWRDPRRHRRSPADLRALARAALLIYAADCKRPAVPKV